MRGVVLGEGNLHGSMQERLPRGGLKRVVVSDEGGISPGVCVTVVLLFVHRVRYRSFTPS